MLTDEERAAALRLCEASTPGPWDYDQLRHLSPLRQDADVAFIASARTLLPAALSDLALMHGRVLGLGAVVDMRGETIARLETENRRLSELHEGVAALFAVFLQSLDQDKFHVLMQTLNMGQKIVFMEILNLVRPPQQGSAAQQGEAGKGGDHGDDQ